MKTKGKYIGEKHYQHGRAFTFETKKYYYVYMHMLNQNLVYEHRIDKVTAESKFIKKYIVVDEAEA